MEISLTDDLTDIPRDTSLKVISLMETIERIADEVAACLRAEHKELGFILVVTDPRHLCSLGDDVDVHVCTNVRHFATDALKQALEVYIPKAE